MSRASSHSFMMKDVEKSKKGSTVVERDSQRLDGVSERDELNHFNMKYKNFLCAIANHRQ